MTVVSRALVWKLATHAIVGLSLAVTTGELAPEVIDETVVRLLCMTGIGADEARNLAVRPRPNLGSDDVDILCAREG
jgi:hypothetical protein